MIMGDLTREVVLQKMMKYCAYRERCHQEVRTKLLEHKIYGDELEEIIATLISENFLNEERYARAFVRGKFRINQWGKQKIKQGLKAKNISDYCIRKGFEEIDEEEYLATINSLITKRITKTKAQNAFELRNKLVTYLVNKGYETDLAWQKVKEMVE